MTFRRCRLGLRGVSTLCRASLRRVLQRPPCPWCVLGAAPPSNLSRSSDIQATCRGSVGVSSRAEALDDWSRGPDRGLRDVLHLDRSPLLGFAAPPSTYTSDVASRTSEDDSRACRPRGFSPPRRFNHPMRCGLVASHCRSWGSPRLPLACPHRPKPLSQTCERPRDATFPSKNIRLRQPYRIAAAFLPPRGCALLSSRSRPLRRQALLLEALLHHIRRVAVSWLPATPSTRSFLGFCFPSEVLVHSLPRAWCRDTTPAHDVAIVRPKRCRSEPDPLSREPAVGPAVCPKARDGSSPCWMPGHSAKSMRLATPPSSSPNASVRRLQVA
jgi:hypothetical protein